MRTILTDSYVRKMCLNEMKARRSTDMKITQSKNLITAQPDNPLLIEGRQPAMNFTTVDGNYRTFFPNSLLTRADGILNFVNTFDSPPRTPTPEPNDEPELRTPPPVQELIRTRREIRPRNRLIENF